MSKRDVIKEVVGLALCAAFLIACAVLMHVDVSVVAR